MTDKAFKALEFLGSLGIAWLVLVCMVAVAGGVVGIMLGVGGGD